MQHFAGKFRVTFLLIALIGFVSPLSAQFSIEWNQRGPDNQGGRIRALHVDDDGTVWAGAVGGGLWRSTDKGNTWGQVAGYNEGDFNLAISDIYKDGNFMMVATGTMAYPVGLLGTFDYITDVFDNLNTAFQGYPGYAGTPGGGV